MTSLEEAVTKSTCVERAEGHLRAAEHMWCKKCAAARREMALYWTTRAKEGRDLLPEG